MTSVSRSDPERPPPAGAPARPGLWPLALIAAVLIGGGLVVGLLLGGFSSKHAATASGPRAPGLRAGQLPGALAGKPAPQFRLPDGRGGTVDTRNLTGRPYAITFLYTHCVDVCPTIAEDLAQAVAGLGRESRSVNVVAVSVDPHGDTPAAVRAFAAQHHLPPNFRYAIGTRSQLAPVWKAYFASPEVGDPKTSTHTAAIWLVDAHQRLRALYPGVPSPGDIEHDLRALAAQAKT